MPIVDFHVHVYPDAIAERAAQSIGAFYHIAIRYDGRLATLCAQGDPAGITHYALLAVATRPEQVPRVNDALAERASVTPGKYSGFASVHAGQTNPADEVARAEGLGFKGIKIHPDIQKFAVDDARMFPVYEAMGARMILVTHAGDQRFDYSSPVRLRRVRELFPRLTMVCAHLGGWSVWDEARALLCGQRVFVDTSSCFFWLSPEASRQAIRAYGSEWVLFGTDFPVWDAAEELRRLDAVGLTEAELEAILYQNAKQLLQLDK